VTRILIVNADDFGQTFGLNRGIVEAHDHGIVTSASLMVCFGASSAEAAAYARRRQELSVGLHVDFGEATFLEGRWQSVYERPYGDEAGAAAEVERQLTLFRELVGDDPTHIDSHQHAHSEEPVKSIVIALGERLGVPVRHFSPHVRYAGGFYGQGRDAQPFPNLIRVPAFLKLIRSLAPGVTEVGCHPGYGDGLESAYVREREIELETLCDPRVRRALVDEGVELRSFRDGLTDA
jgi:chitin disaccharide deacetylase